MGNDAALNIVLGSKDETGPGVTSAEGKLAKLKGTVSALASAWSAAGAAATTVAGFLSDAAKASADDEASTNRLAQAVANSGTSYQTVQGQIEARIAANQDLAFSDDQTRESLSLLIAETGSYDEAMKRQKLAMDLSRGANIDLVTASKLLGKVTDENAKVLARYGITVKSSGLTEAEYAKLQGDVSNATDAHAKAIQHLKDVQALQEEKRKAGHKLTLADQIQLRDANAAVALSNKQLKESQDALGAATKKGSSEAELFASVQKKFGGQAKTYADSTAGAIDRIKDRISEWRESIGKSLGPAQTLIALLPGMSTGMTLVGTVAGPVSEAVKWFGNTAAFAAIKSGVVRVATLAWAGVQWVLNAALSANPIALVVLAIAALVAGVIWAYKNVGWFHDAVDKGFASLKSFGSWIWSGLKPVLEWLGDKVKAIADFMGNIIHTAQGLAQTAHNLHVPGFDWGGKVQGPIGAPRIILAHGGEEVLTAGESSLRDQGFGRQVAVVAAAPDVNVYIGTYVGDASKLSKLLAHELRLAGAF